MLVPSSLGLRRSGSIPLRFEGLRFGGLGFRVCRKFIAVPDLDGHQRYVGPKQVQ